jgi:serine protease Do
MNLDTEPTPDRRPSNTGTRWVIAPLLAAMLASGAVGGLSTQWWQQRHAAPARSTAVASTPGTRLSVPDFSTIAQAHGDAVVNIAVSGTRRVAFDGQNNPFEGIPGWGSRQPSGPQTVRGQGSGFIVDADGVILTNAHVVEGAQRVTVKLRDRREYSARVVGVDQQTDVAVLKIDAKGLPVAPLGSEQSLKVGEWVLAIGSPFGFENTATAGVVSAKGRSLPDETTVPFIQTDVAINPGNSGGPLFNADGQVVGINSQIYSQTGGYQGLAFAIPIDVALKVKDQIMRTGHAEHARLGVAAQEVDQALAESFGLQSPRGALITDVETGSPAQRAGLRAGDVILSLGPKKIDTVADLPLAIGQAKPGDRVDIGYWRERHDAHATAELADARAKTSTTAKAERGGREWGGDVKLGLALRPLTPGEREASGQRRGLLIEGVTGPAETAGVSPGDILIGINGQPVSTPDEVRAAVKGLKGSVALQLRRDDAVLFVPVQVG